jgi:hypothetical protein
VRLLRLSALNRSGVRLFTLSRPFEAQHKAVEAYIRSQAHDGWTLIRARDDDGGYFRRLDRPLRPAAAVGGHRDRRIDIVVAFKGRPPDPLARAQPALTNGAPGGLLIWLGCRRS